MRQTPERFAPSLPSGPRDTLINDTGGELNKGDLVYINPANATAGVSKTETIGSSSWLYHATKFATAGGKAGKLRIVASDGPIAAGAQFQAVGREPCIHPLRVQAAQSTTVAAGANLCPENDQLGAESVIASGFSGVRICARTLVSTAYAAGETEKLILCEFDGERGFGDN